VLGFDSLNEPNLGMAGWPDLAVGSLFLRQGPSPTWFESLRLGEGFEASVAYYNPSLVPAGRVTLNTTHVRAWKRGCGCVWRQHGVWDIVDDKPVLLKRDYFKWRVQGGQRVPVDLARDYFVPFALCFKAAINKAVKARGGARLLVFLDRDTSFEDASIGLCPTGKCRHALAHALAAHSLTLLITGTVLGNDPAAADGFVWAPHWYDLVPIVMKSFRSWVGVARDQGWGMPVVFGNSNLVREYCRQLRLLHAGGAALGNGKGVPTLVGELGIPFDMNEGEAYRTGDFSLQISAMDTTMQALDMALLSGVLWNYTPDNTNKHGDGWNGEDLSIFSRDQVAPGQESDLFAGGRALAAIVRPYAARCAGIPLRMHFDLASRRFCLRFEHDPAITSPTLIFVPFYQYPEVLSVHVSDGTFDLSRRMQTLTYYHDATAGHEHTVILEPHLQRVVKY